MLLAGDVRGVSAGGAESVIKFDGQGVLDSSETEEMVEKKFVRSWNRICWKLENAADRWGRNHFLLKSFSIDCRARLYPFWLVSIPSRVSRDRLI